MLISLSLSPSLWLCGLTVVPRPYHLVPFIPHTHTCPRKKKQHQLFVKEEELPHLYILHIIILSNEFPFILSFFFSAWRASQHLFFIICFYFLMTPHIAEKYPFLLPTHERTWESLFAFLLNSTNPSEQEKKNKKKEKLMEINWTVQKLNIYKKKISAWMKWP